MENKKKINWLIVVIALLSIILIGLLIWLFFGMNNKNNAPSNNNNNNSNANNTIANPTANYISSPGSTNNISNSNITGNTTTPSSTIEVGDYIYDKDIESITLKYYIGYNFETMNTIISLGDDFVVPLQSINLSGNDLTEVASLLKNLKKIDSSQSSPLYQKVEFSMTDQLKIEINNNFAIFIGDEYGSTEDKSTYFAVSKNLFNKITEIVSNYNDTYVYKTFNSSEMSVTYKGKTYDISEPQTLKSLSDAKYYVIKMADKDFEADKIEYTLNLSDGRKVDILSGSVLSRITYSDGTHEYIYSASNLRNILKNWIN